ncbi:hypothetical protein [Cupriavidus sp. WS]|uniref:hypothetical protein n=1 Tax=Cupriavidus sp. WS TaxID=1312922 RepID=UPI0012DD1991|nr:hypothetical protein [Cupriavidus sp. WS]
MSKDARKSRSTGIPEPQTVVELAAVVGIGKFGGSDRAESLSNMLRENFSALRDELLRDPIDDAFTLLVLLGLERAKKPSKAEKLMLDLHGQNLSSAGRKGAEVRHGQRGGYWEKKDEMRKRWASGKYKTRDDCADQEHKALGISRDTSGKRPTPPSR